MPGFVTVPSYPRRSRRRSVLVAVAVVLVLLAVAAIALLRPTTVTADGTPIKVRPGTYVADLRHLDVWDSSAGDLIAVDGSVLTTGGGEPPVLLVNGQAADDDGHVYANDAIESRPGSDRRESIITTTVPVPYKTVLKGRGSLSRTAQEGVEGVARVTMGAASGTEVSRVVVTPPVDLVIERHRPKPGQKVVALTFDDGPWPGQTDKILDVLKRNDAKATFFMLGVRVKKSPALARRVVAEGHLVGNHSLGHRSFQTSSAKEVKRQIVKGRSAIKKATGVDTPWLRPPYGAMDKGAWKVVKKTDSRVVMWTVDSRDWTKPGAKKIAKSVVKHTKPGSIILFHDGGVNRRQTIQALPIVIRELRKKGYEFVTIDELAALDAAQR